MMPSKPVWTILKMFEIVLTIILILSIYICFKELFNSMFSLLQNTFNKLIFLSYLHVGYYAKNYIHDIAYFIPSLVVKL